MKNFYYNDKPVESSIEDKFQRQNFSDRIASTIINNKSSNGVVIGLYGKWGEGKTTVLNFIRKEIETNSDFIILNFNPWRYSNEEDLIKLFFYKVSELLQKDLDSNKEKLGKFIEKYGSITNLFGFDAPKAVNFLLNIDLEELKDRIDSFLKESEKKLIVFIDDIDRLNKDEIFTLFRLVKLTGDFKKTTYILSFDETMVANAIGSRFGGDDIGAGFNFLEKIIQVPLRLPKISHSDLLKYNYDKIGEILFKNEIKITENDQKVFFTIFSKNLANKLTTPRMVLRYANTLSFSLPLMKEEVNIIDLMLIEAVKVFYPEYYDFIRDNSHFFLFSYDKNFEFDNGIVNERKKILEGHLEKLESKLSSTYEKKNINDLLVHLFPRLNEVFYNSFLQKGERIWRKNKRIGSSYYFQRYFTYSLLKEDLSDFMFDNMLRFIELEDDIYKIFVKFQNLKLDYGISELIEKFNLIVEDLNWEISKKTVNSLVLFGSVLNNQNNNSENLILNDLYQICSFIYNVLSSKKNEPELLAFSKTLMHIKPFSFAFSINEWIRTGRNEEDKIYSRLQELELANELKINLFNEAGDKMFFTVFKECVSYIVATWHEYDIKGFNKYFKEKFSNPENVKLFIISIVPTGVSSKHPFPYMTTFTDKHFNFLKSFFNIEELYAIIKNEYSDEMQIDKVIFSEEVNYQTEINVLRQFEYWYKNDLSKKDKKGSS